MSAEKITERHVYYTSTSPSIKIVALAENERNILLHKLRYKYTLSNLKTN